jgi:hypothetical protein
MTILGKLKNPFSRSSALALPSAYAPENRTLSTPPKRQREHTIFVNSDAEKLNISKPSNNHYLARPAKDYKYAGTIPNFERDPTLSELENNVAAFKHHLNDNKNKKLLDKAVFLLSQTDDGRRLLNIAQEQEYTFVFDTEYMEKEGAAGMHDSTKKLISLKEGLTAENVTLTLKHELQHMDDSLHGISYSSDHTLTSATIAQRTLEANARLSEAIAAIELYSGSPNGPEGQYRSASLFRTLYTKHPEIADIAFRHVKKPKTYPLEKTAQDIFKAYWNKNDTLNFYDARLAKMYADRILPPVEHVFDTSRADYANLRDEYKTQEKYIYAAQLSITGMATNGAWENEEAFEKLKDMITIKGKPFFDDTSFLSDPSSLSLAEQTTSSTQRLAAQASAFSPELNETLSTNMYAPSRIQTEEDKGFSSPFPPPETTEKEFLPIQLPHERDSFNHLTNGQTANESVTKDFEQIHAKTKHAPASEIEQINIAVSEFCDDPHQNTRGHMSDLVTAGLRAPMAALPTEYIVYMCEHLNYSSQHGIGGLSAEDLIMIEHWQEMTSNGYHPIYGCPYTDFDKDPKRHMNDAQDFSGTSTHYCKSSGLTQFIDNLRPSNENLTLGNPVLTA